MKREEFEKNGRERERVCVCEREAGHSEKVGDVWEVIVGVGG
jgi:hypothetical protein